MSHRLLPLLAVTLVLTGCFSLPRENLEIVRYSPRPDDLGARADTTFPHALAILPFESAATQPGDRIVRLGENQEMASYYYHRWIAPPDELISDILTEDLTESGLFGQGVFRQTVGTAPRYELRGRLVHLYADNRPRAERAVFEVVVSVFRLEPPLYQKTLALQRTYHFERPRGDNRVASYVPATTASIAEWLTDLRADLTTIMLEDIGPGYDGEDAGPLPLPQQAVEGMREGLRQLETTVESYNRDAATDPDTSRSED